MPRMARQGPGSDLRRWTASWSRRAEVALLRSIRGALRCACTRGRLCAMPSRAKIDRDRELRKVERRGSIGVRISTDLVTLGPAAGFSRTRSLVRAYLHMRAQTFAVGVAIEGTAETGCRASTWRGDRHECARVILLHCNVRAGGRRAGRGPGALSDLLRMTANRVPREHCGAPRQRRAMVDGGSGSACARQTYLAPPHLLPDDLVLLAHEHVPRATSMSRCAASAIRAMGLAHASKADQGEGACRSVAPARCDACAA